MEVLSFVVTLPNVGGAEFRSEGVKVSSIGIMVEDGIVGDSRSGLGSEEETDRRPSFLGFRRPRRISFSLWREKSEGLVFGRRC